jgi:ubiquinone/menaquinone biosynthesis C-methylase UbiE
MAQQERWQLEGSAPELYERYVVPAVTAVWAADLVAWAMPRPGERVLDVACGTGIVARLAAERLSGDGRLVGLDINSGMLAVARSVPPHAGLRIEWIEGSALEMSFPDRAFDLVLCQLGLQFFPDRLAALREMWRVLESDGRLALNVYTAIERNPAANVIANALDRHISPAASAPRRAEHVLADAEQLRELVEGAHFREVTIRTKRQMVRYPSAREYVRITFAASPLASIVGPMEETKREALVEVLADELTAALQPQAGEADLTFPQEAHVLLARK